jgi:hypothetical protein
MVLTVKGGNLNASVPIAALSIEVAQLALVAVPKKVMVVPAPSK